MAISINQQVNQKHLVAVGNNKAYAEGSVAGTLTEVSGITVDTTDNLNMFSGLQRAFIVNGENYKIVDFVNTKLTLDSALTTVPTRGSIITGDSSGATMSVDFVNTAKGIIYGYTLSGTFITGSGETLSGGDMDPETRYPSAVDEASTAPHGYDWTPYPDGSSGAMPTKSYLGCWYRGRAVVSGSPDDPHQWAMSRQLNPFDWAYIANDAQTPVAGTNADAGKVGDIVRALIPFHDDYMFFGCASSMHYLQGDPAVGGELHSLDDFTGIFGAQSWCFDDLGDLYMFGTDGISRVRRGQISLENISQFSIPKLLEDEAANPETHRIVLGFDKRRDGIVISITRLADGNNSNYFYSIKSQGFFPETYPTECGIYSMMYYPANNPTNANLLVGNTDGYIRIFDDSAKDDDIGETNQAIVSEVLMPLQNLDEEADDGRGRLTTTTIIMAGGAAGGSHADSDGLTVDIHVNDDAETLVEAVKDGDDPLHTVTVTGPGRQNRIRKRARAKYLGIVLKNITASESWALGKLSIGSKRAGRIK